jgi:hypothetical protein
VAFLCGPKGALGNELLAEKIETAQAQASPLGPPFTSHYRPGNGISLEGANELWSLRFSLEARLDIPFQHGEESAGKIKGEPFDRRVRPFINVCVVHCIYELELEFDVNENRFVDQSRSTKRLFAFTFQRAISYFHFEKVSPLLPTFYGGFGYTFEINPYRRGDFTTSAQPEYDLLSRSNGFDEGRFVNSVGLLWSELPLNGLGIPGRARLNVIAGRIGTGGLTLAGSDEVESPRRSIFDAELKTLEGELRNFGVFKDYSIAAQIEPFSELKSKWVQGLGFSMGAWFCDVSIRPEALFSPRVKNDCNNLRIRDNGDGSKQILFGTRNIMAHGLAYFLTPGIQWEIGPYRLRAAGGFQRYQDNGRHHAVSPGIGQTRGSSWLLAHELFLWSPKGFLTGSAETAGSVLFGTHFERNSVDCNAGGGKSDDASGCGDRFVGGFQRNVVLLREWDLWYFFMNRMSVGVSWLWYDAKNLSSVARRNLGLASRTDPSTRGGHWLDVNLAWRWRF